MERMRSQPERGCRTVYMTRSPNPAPPGAGRTPWLKPCSLSGGAAGRAFPGSPLCREAGRRCLCVCVCVCVYRESPDPRRSVPRGVGVCDVPFAPSASWGLWLLQWVPCGCSGVFCLSSKPVPVRNKGRGESLALFCLVLSWASR